MPKDWRTVPPRKSLSGIFRKKKPQGSLSGQIEALEKDGSSKSMEEAQSTMTEAMNILTSASDSAIPLSGH